MSHAFARFMSSSAGRATRVVAGLGLAALAARRRSPGLAAAAAVPLAAGALDVCLVGPVLGFPFEGAAARAATA